MKFVLWVGILTHAETPPPPRPTLISVLFQVVCRGGPPWTRLLTHRTTLRMRVAGQSRSCIQSLWIWPGLWKVLWLKLQILQYRHMLLPSRFNDVICYCQAGSCIRRSLSTRNVKLWWCNEVIASSDCIMSHMRFILCLRRKNYTRHMLKGVDRHKLSVAVEAEVPCIIFHRRWLATFQPLPFQITAPDTDP